jgi:hypothetical protein
MRNDPEMQARIAANASRLADVKRDTPLLEKENAARHRQIKALKENEIDHLQRVGMDLEFRAVAPVALLGTVILFGFSAITGMLSGMVPAVLTGIIVTLLPITGVFWLDRKAFGRPEQHLIIAMIMPAAPAAIILLLLYLAFLIPMVGIVILMIGSGLAILTQIGPPAAFLGMLMALLIGFIRTRLHFRRMRAGAIPVPEGAWEKLSERREELV